MTSCLYFDLDETMMNGLQFKILQAFPCAQGEKRLNCLERQEILPKEDSKMFSYLMTMAKNCQNMMKRLSLI